MNLKYLRNVATLKVDSAACSGCGLCVTVCPRGVLAMDGGKARVADLDACMECGACARNCPAGAVSVQAGVGCAYAILRGLWRGTQPDCGCGPGKNCCG